MPANHASPKRLMPRMLAVADVDRAERRKLPRRRLSRARGERRPPGRDEAIGLSLQTCPKRPSRRRERGAGRGDGAAAAAHV